jgi:hypothetical protein
LGIDVINVAAIASPRPRQGVGQFRRYLMFETTRGTPVPARRRLLALVFALVAAGPIAAAPTAALADDGLVDVRTLPRLEGAMERTDRTTAHSLNYAVPTPVTVTSPAIEKLMAANGWMEYLRPLEPSGGSLLFKKGGYGLFVDFTQRVKTPDQSSVSYHADRLDANVPFPTDATGILFDARRPYLKCTTAATVEASLDFFNKELPGYDWSPLSAADAAAHWPNAKLDDKPANGATAYYGYNKNGGGYQQPPIMLSLQRGNDGRTMVEIKVAPFALPQNLAVIRDTVDLPEPDHTPTFGSTGSRDSDERELHGVTVAEIPVVLAFYRRELAERGWTEETRGAAIADDEVTVSFFSADQTATLRLTHKYDLTVVGMVAQTKPSALAARAKARKDADDKFMSDAETMAKQFIAADEVRRAAQAAGLSDAPLQALAPQTTPVPLPEGAENVDFKAADGRLEFDSASSVKALAAFYRGALKATGWHEAPSVINKPNMAVMEFSKGAKKLSFTVMQMGPKVNVSADGSGLVMADASPAAADDAKPDAAAGAAQALEPEPDSALPVPKQHSMSSIGSSKPKGGETPFRHELQASVPAELGAVLAFYRRELGKLGWKETAERTVVKPDHAELAFATPNGPATLKLGRSNDETTVELAQKIPAAAAKADVMPKPGHAKLLFSSFSDSEITVTINRQTVKIPAGAGGPQSKGPTLELPPGKYRYSLKVAAGPAQSHDIELHADDAWGLMVSSDGDVLPLQVY